MQIIKAKRNIISMKRYKDSIIISRLAARYICGELSVAKKSKLASLLAANELDDAKSLETIFGPPVGTPPDDATDEQREVVLQMIRARMERSCRLRRRIAAVSATAAVAVVAVATLFFLNRGGGAEDTPILSGAPQAVLSIAGEQRIDLNAEEQGTEWMKYLPETEDTAAAEPYMLHIEVPQGGEYRLELADGTVVWLNSESKFSYPSSFRADGREVQLSGEAYFEVAHDDRAPFTVATPDDVRVAVLGTSFNLSAYPAESRTVATLVSGRVEVSTPAMKVELSPGMQAVAGGDDRIAVSEVDARMYTSWKDGVFEFENMTMKDISLRLERWYGVRFTFADGAQDERFTGGIIKSAPLQESLADFERTTDLVFRRRGDEIKVGKKR